MKLICPVCKQQSVDILYGCSEDVDLFSCTSCDFERTSTKGSSPYDKMYKTENYLIDYFTDLRPVQSYKVKKDIHKTGYNGKRRVSDSLKLVKLYILEFGMKELSFVTNRSEKMINERIKDEDAHFIHYCARCCENSRIQFNRDLHERLKKLKIMFPNAKKEIAKKENFTNIYCKNLAFSHAKDTIQRTDEYLKRYGL
jgi:hypothetical protein